MRYLTDEEYVSGEFVDTKEACDILNLSKDGVRECIKYLNFDKFQYRVGKTLYHLFKKEDLITILKLRDEFDSIYTSIKDAESKLEKQEFNSLERFDIPIYIKHKNSIFRGARQAVKIEDINKFLNHTPKDTFKRLKITDETIIAKDYYSLQEATDLLGISVNNVKALVSERKTPRAVCNNKVYYSKKEFDALKKEQEIELPKYLTQREAISQGYVIDIVNKTKPHAVPRHFRTERFDYGKIKNMYLIEDLEKTKNSRFSANPLFGNINADANIMFLLRLDAYTTMKNGIDLDLFKKDAPFTINLWLHHTTTILSNSRSSSSIKDRTTREYVYLTKALMNMCTKNEKVIEIYNLETAEIILFLKSCNTREVDRLLRFLNFTYKKIKMEFEKNSVIKQVYDIARINEVFGTRKQAKVLSADTYSPDKFLKILDYCMDVEKHISNSINEISNSNTAKYVSSWLYVLIHMNNGWRSGDVVKLKSLEIDDILREYQIWDISWFENNRLTESQSRIIISKIINRGLITSKTDADGQFYCSDDIVIPVVTSIILLTLFKNSNYTALKDSGLFQFETKHGYPSTNVIATFFKDLDIKNFVFKSKKMNSTLMTLLYSLKSENLKGDRAIQLAQTLRSHKNLKSTLHYLNIDKGYLDVLSRQLCRRGEFGYIYSILVNEVNPEKCTSLETITNEVLNIKKSLGNIFNIEILAGYVNNFEENREEILNNILSSSYEDTVYKVNQIQLGLLHSKESNIQCFIGGENCRFKHSCKYCPYSIPSIYALNDICSELLKLLKEYHEQTIFGEKIKLSVKINHQLQIISECAQIYGLDFIYNMISMSKEEFEDEILKVDEPEDLFEDTNLLV